MVRLLTVHEVADILRLTTEGVYRLARRRAIPVVHVGRQVRVPEEGLRRWLEAGGTCSLGATRTDSVHT